MNLDGDKCRGEHPGKTAQIEYAAEILHTIEYSDLLCTYPAEKYYSLRGPETEHESAARWYCLIKQEWNSEANRGIEHYTQHIWVFLLFFIIL